jgi:uncharacterized protein YifN (PemK superfamily)
MSIDFAPERGRILMCDFDPGRIPPEMDKNRQVVVMSPRSYNRRHGEGPGRSLVVPFTATDPKDFLTPADVPFRAGLYKSLPDKSWAICAAAMSVSHERLNRVRVREGHYQHSMEVLSALDMARIEEGLRHAFGFPTLQILNSAEK